VTLSPRLSALPEGAFQGLAELRVLALHSNGLVALPDALLRGLGHLRQVSLRHNRLRALPRALFRNLSSLETVQLDHNQLETLPGDVFGSLPQLAEVLLGHNPWLCDCGLWPFVEWLRQHLDLVGRDESPRCHGPEQRAGLSLWALLEGDPWCPSPRGAPPRPPVDSALGAPLPSLLPTGSEPWAWAQQVATGERPDHSLFWGLYFLLLAAQAVLSGIIMFAMIKIVQLVRKLIRERALV
jgi:hypothetical protein